MNGVSYTSVYVKQGLLAVTLTSTQFASALACLLSQRGGKSQGKIVKLPTSTAATQHVTSDGDTRERPSSRNGDEASLLDETAAAIQSTLNG